jgi:hypothetical protein
LAALGADATGADGFAARAGAAVGGVAGFAAGAGAAVVAAAGDAAADAGAGSTREPSEVPLPLLPGAPWALK